ncbi:MAG: superoxide dismutase family protein [Gammaproteobacteria bacterium]
MNKHESPRFGPVTVTLVLALTAGAAPSSAEKSAAAREGPTVTARVIDAGGTDIGFVAITDVASGIIVQADVSGLAPGKHGFHIHETARCDAPEFKGAGGHYAPHAHTHGYLSAGGHHAGDLPNQIVDTDHDLLVSLFSPDMRLSEGDAALLDADGSALIIHRGRDDYSSQPAGDGGPRVACAALTRELLSVAHGQ